MVGIPRLKFKGTLLSTSSRAFSLELPVAVLGFIFVFMTVQLPPLPTQKVQIDQLGDSSIYPRRKMSFDVSGALALSFFVATLVLALSIGGNDVPWAHPAIPTLLVLSAMSFMAFVILERRTLETPLVPLYLVVRRSIWPLFVVTFFKDTSFMTVRKFRPVEWKIYWRTDNTLAVIPHITVQQRHGSSHYYSWRLTRGNGSNWYSGRQFSRWSIHSSIPPPQGHTYKLNGIVTRSSDPNSLALERLGTGGRSWFRDSRMRYMQWYRHWHSTCRLAEKCRFHW